jgi:ATP-binding protein involved in chromosome partitioning
VAVNLALGLAKKGASVGLIDADIYGPSVPIMFGVEDARPKASQNEAGQTRIEPIEKYGIKLLSIGFLPIPISLCLARTDGINGCKAVV